MINNEEVSYTDPNDLKFKQVSEAIYQELFTKILKLDPPDIEVMSKPNEEDEIVYEVRSLWPVNRIRHEE